MRAAVRIFALLMLEAGVAHADPVPQVWIEEWPATDFSRSAVPLEEIMSGGPPKDGIPAIDDPAFAPIEDVELPAREPVIGVVLEGEARAYPLRVLMWHEIVNDEIAGLPIAVTYCPLCNTGIVFDRRLDGRVLDFGTTGKLRHSDLVMYDRQTESWWQQFVGEAIVGELAGATLAMLPSRLESFASFAERAPSGEVLVASEEHSRPYGRNPYVGYDSAGRPFLYGGRLPEEVAPLARVVRVGERAWSLDHLKEMGRIETEDVRLSWSPGQASALDTPQIAQGADVGNVVVERRTAEGGWEDAVHSVDFAFAFKAFYPESEIVTGEAR